MAARLAASQPGYVCGRSREVAHGLVYDVVYSSRRQDGRWRDKKDVVVQAGPRPDGSQTKAHRYSASPNGSHCGVCRLQSGGGDDREERARGKVKA
jgi:hypothetical protein